MRISIGIKGLALTTIEDKKGRLLEKIVQRDTKNHIIPSYSISKKEGDWTICFSEGEFALSCIPKEKRINYQNNNLDNAEWDVLHLSRQTLDRQLQEQGIVSFHSSSLAYGKKGVLFFGGSGSGKSSIVLSAYKKKRFEYISNEVTVIDQNQEIIAGTNLLVLKKGALERYSPELAGRGKKPTPEIRVLYAKDLFQERIAHPPLPLSLIVNPSLRENVFTYKIGKNIMRERLYEDASSYVNGNYLLDKLTKPNAPNLDTIKCKENRARLIINLTESYDILTIEGPPDKILERVVGELER